jgi:DNA gyrase/topoisomerase IV subunit A
MTNEKTVDVVELVKSHMTQYGKAVVEDRAIPDFRDGLKPVHRRILWAAHHDLKLTHTTSYAKSAEVVGATLGNYHPHGDLAVYNAMVTLVGDRYPLIEGQGNFGNHANGPAASRYTECRLTPLAARLFDTVDVVDSVPNYNGKKTEPLVIPSRIPILLMNGAEGIGVGVATNIPSHNLEELVNALVALVEKPGATDEQIIKHVRGPDFYMGGVLISSREDVIKMYKTGHGSLRFRCQFKFEDGKRGMKLLVITGVPPGFNVASFLEWCKKREDDGTLEYANDESCEEDGLRIVVGWKNAYSLNKTLLPQLETSVTFHWHITERLKDDITFRRSGLPQMLRDWLDWRRDVEQRHLTLKKDRLLEQIDRENAKRAAMLNLDKYFQILKTSNDLENDVAKKLNVSLKQATFILETPSRALAKMNEAALQKSIETLQKAIEETEGFLTNIDVFIKARLLELKPFYDKRRTEVGAVTEVQEVKKGKLWLLANKEGQIEKNYDTLTARWAYDFVVCVGETQSTVVTCTRQGLLQPVAVDQIRDGRTGLGDTIAVFVPKAYVIAIDNNGLGCIFTTPTRRTQLIKGNTNIVQCEPVSEKDTLWMWNTDNEDALVLDGAKLKKKVTGSRRVFRPLVSDDYVGGFVVLRPGDQIVNVNGDILVKPIQLFKSKLKDKRWFVVGDKNVVVHERKRELMNREQTIEAIKAGDVLGVHRV